MVAVRYFLECRHTGGISEWILKKTLISTLLIRKADIIRPWFVGRFNEETYPQFKIRIKDDVLWCRKNKLDYAPVVFPGFSWHNMHPESTRRANLPQQRTVLLATTRWRDGRGSEMIYIAMFDEIDEGTAIFKTHE